MPFHCSFSSSIATHTRLAMKLVVSMIVYYYIHVLDTLLTTRAGCVPCTTVCTGRDPRLFWRDETYWRTTRTLRNTGNEQLHGRTDGRRSDKENSRLGRRLFWSNEASRWGRENSLAFLERGKMQILVLFICPRSQSKRNVLHFFMQWPKCIKEVNDTL